MTPKRILLGMAGFFALTLPISGCNRGAQTPANPTPSPITPPASAQYGTTGNTQTQTPIKDSVETFLTQHTDGKLLPKSVRLLSVNLEDKVVTLDFSQEFDALKNMGDSTEAEVQKELRKLLAKFPNVEKMRVTVEGGKFDSQMTDWDAPFPVREENTDDVSQKPDESGGGQ